MSIYLDYNATALVRPEAIAAMGKALASGGNPSSVHALGRAARVLVEDSRAEVARLVGVIPGSITFLSGGTEATQLAIESAVAAGFQRIVVSAIEHEAVVENAKVSGLPVAEWPVGADGVADLDWLEAELSKDGGRAPKERVLVCLMLANNETGVIQPVAEASRIVRAHDGWLHVDAVQAAGKIPVDFNALGADTLAISAHKIGGPQGIGALAAGPRATLFRRIHGGGQERGRRSGTENVPGIAGFAAAAKAAREGLDAFAGQAAWRDAMAERVKALGGAVLGETAPRLPQTLCLAAPGFPSEMQVMSLDLAGVMASAGAACNSGKVKASKVAQAMGHDDLAPFILRLSGGWGTTEADWQTASDVWAREYERRRRKEVA